jgi:hypothetical protein
VGHVVVRPKDLLLDWLSIPKAPHLQEMSYRIKESGSHELLKGSWHFAQKQYLSHTIIQAFKKNNRDDAFDSLQKISNASWDSAEAAERNAALVDIVVIPCLVVQAPLFLAYLDYDAGHFATTQVTYGRLSWSGCRSGTMIDVIHVSALSDYANAVKLTFGKVVELLRRVRAEF